MTLNMQIYVGFRMLPDYLPSATTRGDSSDHSPTVCPSSTKKTNVFIYAYNYRLVAKTSGHVASRERGEEDRKRGEKALKEEIYDLAYKTAGENVSQETMVFLRQDMGRGEVYSIFMWTRVV